MEKRTEGRVKFSYNYAASLAPGKEQISALEAGVFDACLFAPAYAPGKTPLLTIGGGLPFMTPDLIAGGKAYIDFGNQLPEVVQELEQWNAKYVTTTLLATYHILGSKPVTTVEDIAGLKIRTFLGFAKLFNSLGAEVISMPIVEAFTSMQKGILDSITVSYYGMAANKFYQIEGINHASLLNLGTLSSHVAINKKFFDSLPPDIQNIMMKAAFETPEPFAEIMNKAEMEGRQEMEAYGTQFYEFSDSEHQRLEQLSAELVWPDWLKDKEDRGLDGLGAIKYLQDRYDHYLSFQ